jgi:UDP-N-acetyl-D-galactosamine dehydrogenase
MHEINSIGVVGLGYVGLPLVVEFGKTIRTVGFDIDSNKVASCSAGLDPSHEISDSNMANARMAFYTDQPSDLTGVDFVLVAVPTPVDEAHRPDFGPLISASRTIAPYLKLGAIVVYESTVYPGATEEICIPEIERVSGKVWKKDFFVGYSPERINPGDQEHTLTKVVKVVSGDTPETTKKVAELYELIIEPGVHCCTSIKIAEACKVIENTQRDLNIALMNELAIIFEKIGIDTNEVLSAAATKWNFLKFKPGLVGGHCIGVDPYYLTHKAEMLGYHPQIILAGRRINDGMGKYIAEQTIKQMIANGCNIKGSIINILGLTFKENCSDLRNTKVIDIINELKTYGVEVHVSDSRADPNVAFHEYGLNVKKFEDLTRAQAVIVAVAHEEYIGVNFNDFNSLLIDGGILIDVKSVFDPAVIGRAGYKTWRL